MNFAEPFLEIQSIEVAGSTVQVTVRLPGADQIRVILRDVNEIRRNELGTYVVLFVSQLSVSHNKVNVDTADLSTLLTVLGSFGSVVFTDLPAGPTRVRAIGKGADRIKQTSEWFTVTV